MIGVKLSGGLGNQMFQYAFIKSANSKTKKLFFLGKEGDPIELYRYFRLRKNLFYFIDLLFFNHHGFRLFFSHYLRNLFYKIIIKCFIYKEISVTNTDQPKVALQFVENGTLFAGYFQSPLYFCDNLDEIYQVFKLKNRIQASYKRKYQFPAHKKKVVIHVRRTDYAELGHLKLGGKDLSLPFSYYHRLIKNIQANDNFYVFISDDPELVRSEFDYLPAKYISTDCAIIDFQHMLNADTCIIANSTFTWWAAYLNQNPNKVVYCPKYFLGHITHTEYPVNIYPPDWVQVNELE